MARILSRIMASIQELCRKRIHVTELNEVVDADGILKSPALPADTKNYVQVLKIA